MAFPFYKQLDSMDCGPTCLRIVAKYYGKNISTETFRQKTQINKDGINLLGLSETAEFIGFRTRSVKLSFESLTKHAKLPVILHWNQTHFVVLYKVKKNRYFVADPAKGLITFDTSEFKSSWISDKNDGQEEGIALLLDTSPTFFSRVDEFDQNTSKTLGFRNIFQYILPYKGLLIQLFLGLGISSLLQLFLPFLTKSIVDVGINTSNIHFVYVILIAQLSLLAGRMAIEFVRGWILLHISTRVNVSILTDFLIKLMKLPIAFFEGKKTGDILQRMNDHSRIESFLTGSSFNAFFSLFNLLALSIVLAFFNLAVFIVFVIASVLYGIWIMLFLRKRKTLDYKRFEIASKEQGLTIQLVQGIQEIKLHGAERPMRWQWEELQAKLFKLSMKWLSLNQWQQTGAFFINEGKNIFITFLCAKAVIDGLMSLGSMVAVQYLVGQINGPIESIIGLLQSWQNAKISMDRLNEINSVEDEEPDHKDFRYELPLSFAMKVVGGTEIHQDQNLQQELTNGFLEVPEHPSTARQKHKYEIPCISLSNVSFSYPGTGNAPVLSDINLQIPKGKITAIVGVSGSGKTTLLKLLLKFYAPQKGIIKVDNILLENVSHKAWRSYCGVVMQDSFIFSDTIAKNIAVGVEKIDMNRLQNAVDIANISDFIDDLPLGFNSKIGSEGTGVSMGQRQRILIARAVYRNPQFIFFDEATNSLDSNNEELIMENLKSFFENRTVVIVAHRLSTVKNADQIIVLNKGIISELGTHDELVKMRGTYFSLIKNQLELGE